MSKSLALSQSSDLSSIGNRPPSKSSTTKRSVSAGATTEAKSEPTTTYTHDQLFQLEGQPIQARYVNARKLELLLDEKFGDNYVVEVSHPFLKSSLSYALLTLNRCSGITFLLFSLTVDSQRRKY